MKIKLVFTSIIKTLISTTKNNNIKFQKNITMKKIIILNIVIFLSVISLYGQGGNPAVSSSSLSASQGNIPVNPHTGSAQVGVPLFNLEAFQTTLPVMLSYNTTGVRVNDIASNVGLGWNLNAGGVITRQVNHLPDDAYSTKTADNSGCQTAYTYINAGYLKNSARGSEFQVQNVHGTTASSYSENLKHSFYQRGHDFEPDIFYFNVNGMSGKFSFDETGNLQLLSDIDLKITFGYDPNFIFSNNISGVDSRYKGAITSFLIHAPDGSKYLFEEKEYKFFTGDAPNDWIDDGCDSYNVLGDCLYDCGFDDELTEGYVSSWHLTKIYNSLGRTEFKLFYNEEKYFDHSNLTDSKFNDLAALPSTTSCFTFGIEPELIHETYVTKILNITKSLDYIQWGHDLYNTTTLYGLLDFEYSTEDRLDIFMPDLNCITGGSAKKLEKISWKAGNGALIKEIEFGHSYHEHLSDGDYEKQFCTNVGSPNPIIPSYIHPYRKRLRLDYVKEVEWGDDGIKTENPPYTFDYYGGILPPRFSAQQDLWGYYNGSFNTYLLPKLYMYPDDEPGRLLYGTIYSVFPRSNYIGSELIVNGADRSANSNVIKYGTLNRITYPTGAETEFDLGIHDFLFDGQTFQGGGLRVNSVSNGGISTSYLYEDNNETTGRLISLPEYGKFMGCFGNCSSLTNEQLTKNTAVFSTPQNNLGLSHGSPVGYSKVIEDHGSGGKVINNYKLTIFAGSGGDGIFTPPSSETTVTLCDQSDNFPFPPIPNYDWNQGYVTSQILKNKNDVVVKETSYEYKVYDYQSIKAVKTFAYPFVFNSNGCYSNYFRGAVGKYNLFSGDNRLQSVTTKDYADDNTYVENTTSYNYQSSNHKFPTSVSFTNSDGLVYETTYKYPHEMQNNGATPAENTAINDLISSYRIATPIQTIERIGGTFISNNYVQYKIFSNNINAPEHTLAYEDDEVTSIITNTVSAYDSNGFILNSGRPGFPETIYTWDKGSLASQTMNGWTTSYTYNNARLISSVTDPNNIVITKEYDGFQRIVKETSKNGAVTTSISYQVGLNNNSMESYTDYGDVATNNTETQRIIKNYDNLGRYINTVAVNHAPGGGDVIMESVGYDDRGRVNAKTVLGKGTSQTWFDDSPLNKPIKTLNSGDPDFTTRD